MGYLRGHTTVSWALGDDLKPIDTKTLNALSGTATPDVVTLQRELNRYANSDKELTFPGLLEVTGSLDPETARRAILVLAFQAGLLYKKGQQRDLPFPDILTKVIQLTGDPARIWVGERLSRIIGIVRGLADVMGYPRAGGNIPWPYVVGAVAVGGLLLFGRRRKR